MKILVFSDSHGDAASMARAVELEGPDEIFHLGDVTGDARRLAGQFPAIPLVQVRGNCDGWCDVPDEALVSRGGKRLLLTHGHRYRVKSGLELALAAARGAEADALLFGHTHQPLCDLQGGLWVVNPGSIRGPVRRTYAVLTLERGELACRMGALT